MLLTLADLCERWHMTANQVKATVRTQGVPYIPMRTQDLRINWTLVRFRESSIAAWEVEHQREFGVVDEPGAVPAVTTNGRKWWKEE
jgi:hypothetical protein